MSATQENLVRAAKVRGLALANLKEGSKTAPELYETLQGDLEALEVIYKTFSSILGTARKSGLVSSEREGLTYRHWLPNGTQTIPGAKEIGGREMVERAPKGRSDIGITIMKATKVVRLKVGGLIIDIGVE